jgi:hypothetical protein
VSYLESERGLISSHLHSSFGNSLGYVVGDGSQVASQNTPFSGTLETSEREMAVFRDKSCDNNCEYARPESVAHCELSAPVIEQALIYH